VATSNTNFVLRFFNLTAEQLDLEMGEDNGFQFGWYPYELERELGNKRFVAYTYGCNDTWEWETYPLPTPVQSQYNTGSWYRSTTLHMKQALRILGITRAQLVQRLDVELDQDHPDRPYYWCWAAKSFSHPLPQNRQLIVTARNIGDDYEWNFVLEEHIEFEGPTLPYPEDEIPF
jgi:hypothetical protein